MADVPLFRSDYKDANGVNWVFDIPIAAGILVSTAKVAPLSPLKYATDPGTFRARPSLTSTASELLKEQIDNHAEAHKEEAGLLVKASPDKKSNVGLIVMFVGGLWLLFGRKPRGRRRARNGLLLGR